LSLLADFPDAFCYEESFHYTKASFCHIEHEHSNGSMAAALVAGRKEGAELAGRGSVWIY